MILIDKLLYMQLFDFNFNKGSVWLVGAGPGDPGLLTILAYKSIKKATSRRNLVLKNLLDNKYIIPAKITQKV